MNRESRALEESREYILPVRFDDTEIPGLLPTTGFIDLRTHAPVQVALLICEKLGRKPFAAKADQVPSPQNPSLQGEASFNYSSHNGRFRIGEGHFEFETRWGKRDNTSIYCYTHSVNIRGIALAPKGATLASVPPAEKLDFTNRERSPEIGRFVVLQNHNGIYAALQVLEIWDDSRGDKEDYLRFRYWILKDGSSAFSAVQEP